MDGKNLAIGALAVGMAGATWFAYETSHNNQNNPQTMQTPAPVSSNPAPAQTSPASPPVAKHIDKGEVREFRAQTQDQNQRIQELNDQARDLEARLAHKENTDSARVAELEGQLAKTNKELENYRAATANGFANVERRMATQNANRQIQKVRFEAGLNQAQDIGGGITIFLNRTDSDDQIFSARIWFQSENRTFALRGQEANAPLVFYSLKDGKKYEVVVESVKDNSVVGYVTMPS